MNPDCPPSRFHVESGVPYFDAAEDGTPVRHRLTEFRPGLFLADNGETLDLRGPSPRWRGHRPQPGHQRSARLAVGAARRRDGRRGRVAPGRLRRRRYADAAHAGRSSTVGAPPGGRIGRRLTAAVAAVGALAALVTVAVIRAMPGLVDVGFLGWMAFPLPVRLALHLPLAVALLAAGLAALLVAGRAPALVDAPDPAARRGPRRRLDRPCGPARVLAPGRLGVLNCTAPRLLGEQSTRP